MSLMMLVMEIKTGDFEMTQSENYNSVEKLLMWMIQSDMDGGDYDRDIYCESWMTMTIMMTMTMTMTMMILSMTMMIIMIRIIFCQTNQAGKRDKCPVPELKARKIGEQKASKRNQ